MKIFADKFSEFCDKIEEIRGAAVYSYSSSEDMVDLAINTEKNINQAKKIINEYGYNIIKEFESEGSDYNPYCIVFKKESNN